MRVVCDDASPNQAAWEMCRASCFLVVINKKISRPQMTAVKAVVIVFAILCLGGFGVDAQREIMKGALRSIASLNL